MIHVYDDDPRQITDAANYPLNHGSFAAVSINLNKSLKKLGYYAHPDEAEWVGTCASLDTSFKYKDKKNFIISVWETSSMPVFVFYNGIHTQQRIFGLSNQITKLWHKYGARNVSTVYGGSDTDFWYQTKPKNSNQFQFCHVNSSNVRSGLDITVKAFAQAFAGNSNVKLVIKDTNPQDRQSKLLQKINYYSQTHKVQIEYRSSREPATFLRDLYSESHVTLNLLRATSFGMPLLDCSACNSLCITGNIEPTNELIRPEYGVLVEPKGLISVNSLLQDLVDNWGLLNCYGNFPHFEEPCISHFDEQEYAQQMQNIYKNWQQYSTINTRDPIVKNWSWDHAALTLKNQLYGI